jgi:phage/plasmid-associated DNA primase
MARKKTTPKTKAPATLVPDWAVAGLVLLNKKRTPIGDEKGYTHRTAKSYLDPDFDRGKRITAARAHLAGGGSLGLCPPQDVMIIDCDSREAVELIKPLMPRGTPCQFRKEDKQHFYIRIDPALDSFYTNSNVRFDRVVIDLRTWGNVDPDLPGGGYAVIPPSVSEKDGIAYTWETPLPDTIEEIPVLPREVAEILQPFCVRGVRARAPRAAGESRHDRILSYTARCVRYESRSDPEAAIARVVAKGTVLATELYGDETERLRETLNSMERNVRSAWDQWGGDAALDESSADRWMARMISDNYGDPWFSFKQSKMWVEWNGESWAPEFQIGVEQVVQKFTDVLLEDALREANNDRKKRILAMSNATASSSKVAAIVAAMKREFSVSRDLFDANPDLITFPGCKFQGIPAVTLNTFTGEIKPPEPGDYITLLAGAAYGPHVRHPVVDQWWETSFPNPETRRAVEELAGLSICGRLHQEKIISLFGTQGSGKGTLGFSLVSVLGDYGGVFGNSLLSGEGSFDGSRKDFSLINLRGRRLAYFDEFAGNLGEKAKTLAQAGSVTASEKYGSDVTFPMRATLWLSTNRRPKINDPQGFSRRLIEVPMNAGAKDITRLDDSIKYALMNEPKAKSAMLARILKGLDRARENGFAPVLSQEIIDASREWLTEANKIGEWVANGCEITGDPSDSILNAFTVYLEWMENQGMDRRDYPRAHKNEFAGLMRSMGFESKRTKHGAVYVGVRVKPEEHGESSPVGRTGKVRELFKKTTPVS